MSFEITWVGTVGLAVQENGLVVVYPHLTGSLMNPGGVGLLIQQLEKHRDRALPLFEKHEEEVRNRLGYLDGTTKKGRRNASVKSKSGSSDDGNSRGVGKKRDVSTRKRRRRRRVY